MHMKRKHFGLFTFLILLISLSLLLSMGLLSAISLYNSRSDLEDSVEETLFVAANNLANHCRDNHITVMTAMNYYDYLDSLKSHNIEMAIFINGNPEATSIRNENDYRIREIPFDDARMSASGQSGYYDKHVLIDGRLYYGCYLPIDSDQIDGVAFAGELRDHVSAASVSAGLRFAGTAFVLLIIFIVLTVILTRQISRSMGFLEKKVNVLAQGDLTGHSAVKSSIKEISLLLQSTDLLRENMADIIGKVKQLSRELVDNSSSVTQISSQNMGFANNIVASMQGLVQSTEDMSQRVNIIYGEMQEIGTCIFEISENIDHLTASSSRMQDTGDEARGNMALIMQNTNSFVNAVNEITGQIEETNNKISQIDYAIELILDISDQTSLLSLNANIEAARAGEAGKGFAVVAEEIRHLSEQSSKDAEMIRDLAVSIRSMSQKTVELSGNIHTLIAQEQASLSKTQTIFDELGADISQSVDEIRSISQKTGHLMDYRKNVLDNVQHLSEISEDNSAKNRDVNTDIDEILSGIRRMDDNCDTMNHIAQGLDSAVSYFNN